MDYLRDNIWININLNHNFFSDEKIIDIKL